MTIFESVKSAVTPRMAAERYGLQVNRSGMTRCPFHNDRTPSMKLNEDYFYCFGCTSRGDAIDLTAKLFSLSAQDAAKKLASDFRYHREQAVDPDDASAGTNAGRERTALLPGAAGVSENFGGLAGTLCAEIAG